MSTLLRGWRQCVLSCCPLVPRLRRSLPVAQWGRRRVEGTDWPLAPDSDRLITAPWDRMSSESQKSHNIHTHQLSIVNLPSLKTAPETKHMPNSFVPVTLQTFMILLWTSSTWGVCVQCTTIVSQFKLVSHLVTYSQWLIGSHLCCSSSHKWLLLVYVGCHNAKFLHHHLHDLISYNGVCSQSHPHLTDPAAQTNTLHVHTCPRKHLLQLKYEQFFLILRQKKQKNKTAGMWSCWGRAFKGSLYLLVIRKWLVD